MAARNTRQINGNPCYIPALTGLRAVAAYLVFVHHYNPIETDGWLRRLLAQGYIGVTIFFVLSGFLIYHRYANAYFDKLNWSWRVYYQNRFARIVPVYVLVLALTIGVSIRRGQSVNWFEFGLNLSLAKGFFESYKFSGIAQSWSLTVEECFYLAAPLLFVALRRWGPIRLTAFLVSVGLFLWLTVGHLHWHGLVGSLSFTLFYTFFGRSFDFIVGMWLARRWHAGNLPRVRYATAKGLFVLITCVGCQVWITGQTISSNVLVLSEVIAYNIGLPVGIGLSMLGLLQDSSDLKNFLAHPVLQSLGRSAYAFYLIHIGVISKLIQQQLTGANTGMLFILLVSLALCLYNCVEKPLQQRLRAE